MTRNYLEWLTNMPWGVYSKACWIFLVWNRKRHAMTCLLQLSTPAVPWIRALGSPLTPQMTVLACLGLQDTFDLKKAREILDFRPRK